MPSQTPPPPYVNPSSPISNAATAYVSNTIAAAATTFGPEYHNPSCGRRYNDVYSPPGGFYLLLMNH